MRNLITLIILFFTVNTTFGQSYQNELEQANEYLKTIKNGYYGQLDIQDGYLIVRFQSGKESKARINALDQALVVQENKKVAIGCKEGVKCVFSGYTNSYHPQMSFSQDGEFDTDEFVVLLNNLISAYNGNPVSLKDNVKVNQAEKSPKKIETEEWDEEDEVQEELKTTKSSKVKKTENTDERWGNNADELDELDESLGKLNAFLKKINRPQICKEVRLENNEIVFYFKGKQGNDFCSIDRDVLLYETELTFSKGKEIIIECLGGEKCFYANSINQEIPFFKFPVASLSSREIKQFQTLLDELIQSL